MALYDGAIQNVIDAFSSLPGIGQKGAQRIAFYLLQADSAQTDQLAKSIVDLKRLVRFCDICGNVCESSICPICADPRRDPTVLCVVQEPKDVMSIERTHEFHGLYHVLGGVINPMADVRPQDLRISQLLRRLGPHGALTVDETLAATQQADSPQADSVQQPGADWQPEETQSSGRSALSGDQTLPQQNASASHGIYATIAERESSQQNGQRNAADAISNAAPVPLIGRDDVPPVKEVIIALDPDIEGEATTTYLSGLLAPLGITVTRLASGLPVGSDLEYADEMTLARALAGRRRV